MNAEHTTCQRGSLGSRVVRLRYKRCHLPSKRLDLG